MKRVIAVLFAALVLIPIAAAQSNMIQLKAGAAINAGDCVSNNTNGSYTVIPCDNTPNQLEGFYPAPAIGVATNTVAKGAMVNIAISGVVTVPWLYPGVGPAGPGSFVGDQDGTGGLSFMGNNLYTCLGVQAVAGISLGGNALGTTITVLVMPIYIPSDTIPPSCYGGSVDSAAHRKTKH